MNQILAVYRQAGPVDLQARDWYRDANRQIHDLARETGRPFYQVAGVVAALSPRLAWRSNIDDARRVILGERSWALKLNQVKAHRILAGEDPDRVLAGPKVRSFYRNLTDPDDPQAVTVDTWAFRAYSGEHGWIGWIREPQYSRIANAYREAAAQVGLLPSELQAITWVTVRRLASHPGQDLLI